MIKVKATLYVRLSYGDQSQRVKAIKAVMNVTGLCLADAKDLVDKMREDIAYIGQAKFEAILSLEQLGYVWLLQKEASGDDPFPIVSLRFERFDAPAALDVSNNQIKY